MPVGCHLVHESVPQHDLTHTFEALIRCALAGAPPFDSLSHRELFFLRNEPADFLSSLASRKRRACSRVVCASLSRNAVRCILPGFLARLLVVRVIADHSQVKCFLQCDRRVAPAA